MKFIILFSIFSRFLWTPDLHVPDRFLVNNVDESNDRQMLILDETKEETDDILKYILKLIRKWI